MSKLRPHPQMQQTIARNLRRLLDEKKLKAHSLALLAEVDPSNLYDILKGNRNTSTDLLAHLADALKDVKITDFFRPMSDDEA